MTIIQMIMQKMVLAHKWTIVSKCLFQIAGVEISTDVFFLAVCIMGNSVYGAVDSTVAENMVAAEGRTSQAVGMAGMAGTEVDTAAAVTSGSLSSHRSPPFYCHTEKHDNLTDTGCFDDAEN